MDDRLQRAFDALDAENADDPHGKELDHARRAVDWVVRLRGDGAPVELLLAARGHHVRRWEIPRADEPEGRAGYLRWKRRLQQHHADIVGRVLRDVGYDDATVERVQAIVRKERLRSDPDVVTFEDALALVFLETQLRELDERIADDDHMVEILVKTLRKMSDDGRAAAASLAYTDEERALVERAVAAL